MAKVTLPSQAYIRQRLDYDQISGLLFWKSRPESDFAATERFTAAHLANIWNSKYEGKPAGGVDREGYIIVCIDYQKYRAHRLIWKRIHNEEPDEVDHRNLEHADNKLKNLRACSHVQNGCNRRSGRRTIGRLKGASFFRGRWRARIKIKFRSIQIGTFDTPEEAHAAYCAAAIKYHGEWADIVLASGALQCIPQPEETFDALCRLGAHYIVLSQVPLISKQAHAMMSRGRDYPLWMFSEPVFRAMIAKRHNVLAEWNVPKDDTMPDGETVNYRGFLLESRATHHI